IGAAEAVLYPAEVVLSANRHYGPGATLQAREAGPRVASNTRNVIVRCQLDWQRRPLGGICSHGIGGSEKLLKLDAIPCEVRRDVGSVLRFKENFTRGSDRPVRNVHDT